MRIKKDMFGQEFVIGSKIAFNPPHYKGIEIFEVVNITGSGSPVLVRPEQKERYFEQLQQYQSRSYLAYTPRTSWIVVDNLIQDNNG